MSTQHSVTQHVVDIYPPTKERPTWLAKCSMNDFSQSYLNRVEAHVEGTRHYTGLMIVNDLEQGVYTFDDGRNSG